MKENIGDKPLNRDVLICLDFIDIEVSVSMTVLDFRCKNLIFLFCFFKFSCPTSEQTDKS